MNRDRFEHTKAVTRFRGLSDQNENDIQSSISQARTCVVDVSVHFCQHKTETDNYDRIFSVILLQRNGCFNVNYFVRRRNLTLKFETSVCIV